jgi:hypothetical protein
MGKYLPGAFMMKKAIIVDLEAIYHAVQSNSKA